jgi:hypothetical protein
MKAKLIKTDVNYLLEDSKGVVIGSTSTKEINKLSKQNCDEIFGVVDVEKLAEEDCSIHHPYHPVHDQTTRATFIRGFNKAIELNKDRVFTVEDMHEALHLMNNTPEVKISGEALDIVKKITEIRENIISKALDSKKPKEIEVGIEMICPHPEDTYRCGLQYGCGDDGCYHPNKIPYLDPEGCLILKKI